MKNYDFQTGKYKDNNYERFWEPGGSCGFSDEYSTSYVNRSEWSIDECKLPDELKAYVYEIDQVFNANVEYGCCGGCL